MRSLIRALVPEKIKAARRAYLSKNSGIGKATDENGRAMSLWDQLVASENAKNIFIARALGAEKALQVILDPEKELLSEGVSNLRLMVVRGGQVHIIDASEYDKFEFCDGDEIQVLSLDQTHCIVRTPDGNTNVLIGEGKAIRVPSRMELFEYNNYKLPAHLVVLTGAGPDSWKAIAEKHIESYLKWMKLAAGMSFLEIGSGIGRDALELINILGSEGKYIGIDVTRDSVLWCQKNITPAHPNFVFHHFDAEHELYNPLGTKTSLDFSLPVANESVDRIALGSVFTHLFEEEIVHYMREIRRVLKPDGIAWATFFLYSDKTVSAARRTDVTPFKLRFEHPHGKGCYINDAAYPTGAVAFTEKAISKMISQSGLALQRPILNGWWSGAYKEAEDGQEVALLCRDSGSTATVS